MFEDAMMESGGTIVTRTRYYTLFGALLNVSLLGGLILMPLLHPEALPKNAMSELLIAPAPPPPPPAPAPQTHVTRVIPQLSEFAAPRTIPQLISMTRDISQPPAANPGVENMSASAASSPGLSDLLGCCGAPPPLVRAPVPTRIIVSQGVMTGNILSRPQPTYPAIAKSARIQGTVVLSATISKTGTIENLSVVSGPQMLTQSALDAVRNWRYKPYLLNGEPVEVKTTVSVNFTLGG